MGRKKVIQGVKRGITVSQALYDKISKIRLSLSEAKGRYIGFSQVLQAVFNRYS